MFIALLFAAAFMFFVADRKIRFASLAGIISILFASMPLSWFILFYNYKLAEFLSEHIEDFDRYDRNSVCFVLALLISLISSVILLFFAKMWSREIFTAANDGIGYSKKAKTLFVAASSLTGIVALWLALCRVLRMVKNISFFMFFIGNIGYNFFLFAPGKALRQYEYWKEQSIATTVYVTLLLAFCVLCLILISRKNIRFKKLKEKPFSSKGYDHRLSVAGITATLSGVLTCLTKAHTGYSYSVHVTRGAMHEFPMLYSIYFGYFDRTPGMFKSVFEFAFGVFTGILMLAGSVMLLFSLIKMISKKTAKHYWFSLVFSVILIAASAVLISMMIKDAAFYFSLPRTR